jgi:hypothetical protein
MVEKIGAPPLDAASRFAFDNLTESVKDRSILMWYALDTQTGRPCWVIGRRINEGQVLPLGVLEPDSEVLVKRYAPATVTGWDYSQIPKDL